MGKGSSKHDGSGVIMLTYYGVYFEKQVQGLVSLKDVLSIGEIPISGQLIRVMKKENKNRFIWFDGFGRNPMGPQMERLFQFTDVMTFVINPDRELFLEPMFIQKIYATTSHPDLSHVTIFVIATKCDENSVDVMSADEVRKKFEEHSLVFPNQKLYITESDKLDNEVIEEAFRLADQTKLDQRQTKASDGGKMVTYKSLKLKNKIAEQWKSLWA